MNLIARRNDIFNDSFINEFFTNALQRGTLEPRANVSRTKTNLTIDIELPGFSRSDIMVESKNNTLSVIASRNQGKTEYETQEFGAASLKRSWSLPRSVNVESIEAAYDAGILTITLPYKTETIESQRKIEIR